MMIQSVIIVQDVADSEDYSSGCRCTSDYRKNRRTVATDMYKLVSGSSFHSHHLDAHLVDVGVDRSFDGDLGQIAYLSHDALQLL